MPKRFCLSILICGSVLLALSACSDQGATAAGSGADPSGGNANEPPSNGASPYKPAGIDTCSFLEPYWAQFSPTPDDSFEDAQDASFASEEQGGSVCDKRSTSGPERTLFQLKMEVLDYKISTLGRPENITEGNPPTEQIGSCDAWDLLGDGKMLSCGDFKVQIDLRNETGDAATDQALTDQMARDVVDQFFS